MTLSMDGTISTEIVLAWNTDNVAEWLKAIGLEKYVTKFKRNMITGAVLVQFDELLLDDLNITNASDRGVLLQSVATFTGNVEDCIKTGSINQSSLISIDENKNENQYIMQPEMEVLKKNETENGCEEKTTTFPAFAELLPTIGEEDELNEGGEKIHSEKPPTMLFSTSVDNNDDAIQKQLEILVDNKDFKEENRHTEPNINVCKNTASTSSGHGSNEERLEDDEVASRATQIVQVFSEENMCLRKQLEKYYQEIKHLKSVDKELRDTQIMYKDLKSAFITREHKEKAMRLRMEAEIAQLQNTNAELTDELKELQTVLASRPENEMNELRDEINQRDDEVKHLQKERRISKTSLQNLERMLKQKSSEIIFLQQQLETPTCKMCRSRQIKEEHDNQPVDEPKNTSGDYLEQFYESMMKSCGRNGTRFQNRSNNYHKFRTLPNKQDDLDIGTCVPVLFELLKEKDAEIVKLRKEIEQEMSRLSEITENKWLSNSVSERFPKHRYSKQRFVDLETEIRSLHVQLAEKNAQVQILKCKYGESGMDSSNALSKPFRIPSFTSQSSVSSYQDSGIMTTSDSHYDDTYQDTKDEQNPERYSHRVQESDYDNGLNRRQSNKQKDEATILSDHCWFV